MKDDEMIQEEQSEIRATSSSALVANRFSNGRKYTKNNNNGQRQGQWPRQSQQNKKNVTCFNCGGVGHYADKCPSRNGDSHSQGGSRACSVHKSKGKKSDSLAMVAMSACGMRRESQNHQWIIDSGASSHMVNTMEPGIVEKTLDGICTADGRQIKVAGKGDIAVNLNVNGKLQKCTLKNVLYVPELSCNLLSVVAIMEGGKKVVFDNFGCKIISDGELVATGSISQSNGMMLLDTFNEFASVAASGVSPMTWHRRFGHLSSDYLAKMKGKIGDQGKHGECVTCATGKMEKLPFPRSESRESQCLGLVHSDIAGPMEKESIGGKRYFITFIDDFSRKVTVYMMRNKSEAFNKFKIFQARAERLHGNKIKTLRTDNGGEYCSREFAAYLEQQGIHHQTTVPYNSQQNGVSERMNKTILCKVRCMLGESSLPKNLWAEAVNTAVYLINRSPASAVNFEIPAEIWCARNVSVNHLNVFGSKCVIHIPKNKRRKLDQSGEEGILVGYSESQKAYRVLLKDNTVKI